MVNQILNEEIKNIHGYNLKTRVTKKIDLSKNGKINAK
jgi:stress-induced morphogen